MGTFHMSVCSPLNRVLHFPGIEPTQTFPGDSPGEEIGSDDEGGPGEWYAYIQEDMEKSQGKGEVAENSIKTIRAEASTAPHVYEENVTNDEDIVGPNVDAQFASKLPESSSVSFGDEHFVAAGLDHSKVHIFIDIE